MFIQTMHFWGFDGLSSYVDLDTDMKMDGWGFHWLFTFLAPFPGPTNAVIVTPLKADAAPSTGLVITRRHGGVCFHNPSKY